MPPLQRVLILSADIGEGHDLPGRVIAADLEAEAPGIDVVFRDGLVAMGRFVSAVIRDGSVVAFHWLPWLFELQYWLITRFPPARWFGPRLLFALGGRRLARLIDRIAPDAIVSTYPGTTVVLGELRRRGRLAVPCYSAITDLAGLRFWAYPGIDLHYVTHPESIEEVERLVGPGSATWVRPITSPVFVEPIDRDAARRELALAPDGPVVAVSGGGWGVGDLGGAIEAALAIERAAVICICGRNDAVRRRLERRYGDEPRVRVLGFTDQMSEIMAAADAFVHSTAGLTVLEAYLRGCPVISYGFGIGHIRANNAAFVRFGLARTAGSRAELDRVLREVLAQREDGSSIERRRAEFAGRPSAASLVLAGAGAGARSPAPA